MDPNRAVADDVESNDPASVHGVAQSESRPISGSQGGEAKGTFFQMMNEWLMEFVRTNLAAQEPPPPPIPQPVPVAPQGLEPLRLSKLPVDKILKYGPEEFRATIDDDPERVDFWLENMIRVFDELSCTSTECLKCAVSLLRDIAYQWWNILVSVVPRERVAWEFFQGRMSVTEYEREFVRLSKYARECVSTEAIMCKIFEDGLNKDIRLLVGILELKEFVVLVDRACKAEELGKEKRKADFEARDSRKRSMNKPYQSSSKKSRDLYTRSNASIRYPNRHCGKQYASPKAQATSVSSVGSNARSSIPATRRRPPRNAENVTSSRGTTKDSVVRFEARAPARAYAIRACEDALMLLLSLPFESTGFVIQVSNPLGKYVLVDKVCQNFPLMTRGYYFPANLMLLPFDEFDVILGMDWLFLHDAVVNCRRKLLN
ncbi:Gag-Pol polyprotein [Gossypium australe]|uniref:Gag-Pol polyprotein n=1 Tax=Gossypium australe TaxID=47621 RepID=A0A5B6VBL4_9ROSI|nr:Gag-Pol polyprotein [Gossypium australe]